VRVSASQKPTQDILWENSFPSSVFYQEPIVSGGGAMDIARPTSAMDIARPTSGPANTDQADEQSGKH